MPSKHDAQQQHSKIYRAAAGGASESRWSKFLASGYFSKISDRLHGSMKLDRCELSERVLLQQSSSAVVFNHCSKNGRKVALLVLNAGLLSIVIIAENVVLGLRKFPFLMSLKIVEPFNIQFHFESRSSRIWKAFSVLFAMV